MSQHNISIHHTLFECPQFTDILFWYIPFKNGNKNEWHAIKGLSLNLASVKCALSTSEKFVIIVGGIRINEDESRVHNDRLFVLDITDDENYKLRERGIKIPKNDVSRDIVLMGGEIENKRI